MELKNYEIIEFKLNLMMDKIERVFVCRSLNKLRFNYENLVGSAFSVQILS